MYRAVAWFAHKHGKIDWLESNNEFWLEQDARLRTDFNITSGDKLDSIMRFKTKSNMKAFYQKAGVPVARYHMVTTYEEGKKFVEETGYPVVAKPDNGVGAEDTWKITSDKELQEFYQKDLSTPYIMEEYVPGYIVSYDGLTDQNNNIIFETSHIFPDPVMDIVHEKRECYYWSVREIPEDLRKYGQAVIHAFDIRSRFFHTEYFRLSEDKPGLGNKGDLVGLEVNMRPPGGYTPDMMNFANDIDIYRIYANMCMSNTNTCKTERPYHCIYAGKRDNLSYLNTTADIYARFGQNINMHGFMPQLLADDMGNEFYLARFKSEKECLDFAKYVFEKPKKTRKRK